MSDIQPKLGGYIQGESIDSEKNALVKEAVFPKLTDLLTSGASTVDLRQHCSPVENQWQVGSCVGNAIVGALEMLRIKHGLNHVDLSRLFVYYNSRVQHRAANEDSGTYISLAMGTLKTMGTCAEASWNYDPEKVLVRPSWAAYRDAWMHKIGSYYAIEESGSSRFDAIDFALLSGHPVVFGCTVDKKFIRETKQDGIVADYESTRIDTGGHAMLIVGKRSDGRYIVRNSWGTGWGEEGYCYMTKRYLSDSNARDFWVATAPWL